jgi:hypothetical protein
MTDTKSAINELKRLLEPEGQDDPRKAGPPELGEVLYTDPAPGGEHRNCQNCILWSPLLEQCSIHESTIEATADHVCVVPETLILTDGDWRPASEVSVGSFVLTHKNRWRKITKVMQRPHEGVMTRLKLCGLTPMILTSEHPIYAITRRSRWDNEAGRSWTVSPYRDVFDPEWVEAGKLRIRDVALVASPILPPKGLSAPPLLGPTGAPFDLTGPLARLLGYYLAEGCVCNNSVPFVFGAHEDKYASEVLELGQELFGVPGKKTLREAHNAIEVVFHSKHLSEWLKLECGERCDTKRVPPWLMCSAAARETLVGVWRGDGGFFQVAGARKHDAPRWNSHFTTTSKLLAEQVAVLVRSLGFSTSIQHHKKPASRDGSDRLPWSRVYVSDKHDIPEFRRLVLEGKLDANGSARKRRDDGLWRRPVRSLTEILYTGPVFNFAVEEDESYTTSGGTVHNCGYHIFGAPSKQWKDMKGLQPVNPKFSGLTLARGGTACENCQHFTKIDDEDGVCAAVMKRSRPAHVHPKGCCTRWSRKQAPTDPKDP